MFGNAQFGTYQFATVTAVNLQLHLPKLHINACRVSSTALIATVKFGHDMNEPVLQAPCPIPSPPILAGQGSNYVDLSIALPAYPFRLYKTVEGDAAVITLANIANPLIEPNPYLYHDVIPADQWGKLLTYWVEVDYPVPCGTIASSTLTVTIPCNPPSVQLTVRNGITQVDLTTGLKEITLDYLVTNADTAVLSASLPVSHLPWDGVTIGASDTVSMWPVATITYTLTATNVCGTTVRNVTIEVIRCLPPSVPTVSTDGCVVHVTYYHNGHIPSHYYLMRQDDGGPAQVVAQGVPEPWSDYYHAHQYTDNDVVYNHTYTYYVILDYGGNCSAVESTHVSIMPACAPPDCSAMPTLTATADRVALQKWLGQSSVTLTINASSFDRVEVLLDGVVVETIASTSDPLVDYESIVSGIIADGTIQVKAWNVDGDECGAMVVTFNITIIECLDPTVTLEVHPNLSCPGKITLIWTSANVPNGLLTLSGPIVGSIVLNAHGENSGSMDLTVNDTALNRVDGTTPYYEMTWILTGTNDCGTDTRNATLCLLGKIQNVLVNGEPQPSGVVISFDPGDTITISWEIVNSQGVDFWDSANGTQRITGPSGTVIAQYWYDTNVSIVGIETGCGPCCNTYTLALRSTAIGCLPSTPSAPCLRVSDFNSLTPTPDCWPFSTDPTNQDCPEWTGILLRTSPDGCVWQSDCANFKNYALSAVLYWDDNYPGWMLLITVWGYYDDMATLWAGVKADGNSPVGMYVHDDTGIIGYGDLCPNPPGSLTVELC